MKSKKTALAQGFIRCHDCGCLSKRTDKNRLCPLCGGQLHPRLPNSFQRTAALLLSAFCLYIPANIFPFMTIELYGNRNSSTIWTGIESLMDQKSYSIALIVFLASILIPVLKLIILIYLSATAGNGQRPKFKMGLYHFVEAIGRWSMLDIFLLAVMVAIVKLGKWTQVEPERGAALFLLVVIFTMMASAYFDPRKLWEKNDAQTHSS